MKWPRFSLPSIMAIVAVVGLDCATIVAIGRRTEALTGFITIIEVACLPMVHALALGLGLLVRRGGGARTFLVGFEAAGWLAVGATMIWYDPLLTCVERPVELMSHLFAMPPGSTLAFAVDFSLATAIFLCGQLLVASAAGWLWKALAGRRRDQATRDEGAEHRRLASLVLPVVLIGMSTLTTEIYLRLAVDVKLQRLRPGTLAIVDLSGESMPPAAFPPEIADLQGNRVRVEHDEDDASKFEIIVDSPDPGADARLRHLRIVQVTILDGDRAGRTISLPHSMLRTNSD